MFALVLFDDGIYYICKEADIRKTGDEYIIPYRGSRYAGSVIAVNVKRQELITLKARLEKEKDERDGDSVPLKNSDDCSSNHETVGRSHRSAARKKPVKKKEERLALEKRKTEKCNPLTVPTKTLVEEDKCAVFEEQKPSKEKGFPLKKIADTNCDAHADSSGVFRGRNAPETEVPVQSSKEENGEKNEKNPNEENEKNKNEENEKNKNEALNEKNKNDENEKNQNEENEKNKNEEENEKNKNEEENEKNKNEVENEKNKNEEANEKNKNEEENEKNKNEENDKNFQQKDNLKNISATKQLPETLIASQVVEECTSSNQKTEKCRPLTVSSDKLVEENKNPVFETLLSSKEELLPLENRVDANSNTRTDSSDVFTNETDAAVQDTENDLTALKSKLESEGNEKESNSQPGDDNNNNIPASQIQSESLTQLELARECSTDRRSTGNKPRIISTKNLVEEQERYIIKKPIASDNVVLDERPKCFALEEQPETNSSKAHPLIVSTNTSQFPAQSTGTGNESGILSLELEDALNVGIQIKALSEPSNVDKNATSDSMNITLPSNMTDDDLYTALSNDVWSWKDNELNVYECEVPLEAPGMNDEMHPEKLQSPQHITTVASTSTSALSASDAIPTTSGLTEKRKTQEEEDVDSDSSDNSSDSSYVPEPNTSDASSDEENRDATTNNTSKQSTKSCNASTDLDASLTINKVGHSAPDDNLMFVKTVESGIKKDFCIYCKKEQGKLSRHVIRLHAEEEAVAQFLSFEKGSDERKAIMAKIRKRGQFFFNTNMAVNTGERKVSRRPNAKYGKIATDFVTCPSCFADYAKTSLRHHYRRCGKRNSSKRRGILLASKQITGRIHPKACDILRKKVFPTIQEDDVAKAIRYDELIILFGNKLCQKYKDPHFYDMIRQKLRQLGRFLIEIRKHDEDIRDFFSIFFPKHYDAMIAAVQSLAGLNVSGTGFKVPSLATSLGTLVKQVGKLCISVWIKRQNKEKQTYVEDFMKLLTEDYGASVTRTALETQAQNKRQAKTILPSKGDIQKLQVYLRDAVKNNYEALNGKFSRRAWMSLAEATLISIQLFNRRRAGEIERILICDFMSHEKIDEGTIGETYSTFTAEEKQAAMKYVRFTIRGKLNRTVPVLLHRELLVCCEILLKYRSAAGVNAKNPYLFGIAGTLKGDYKYLRACELIRKFAVDCGAEKPETLRGTILRKHVATMCVNFNLTDNEVSDLASFLGHAEKIHKEHYRQPIICREILQISKLLEAVQGKEDSGDDSDDASNDCRAGTSMAAVTKDSRNEENLLPANDSLLESTSADQNSFLNLGNENSPDEASFKEPQGKRKRSTSPYGKCRRVRWSAKETAVARKTFRSCIEKKALPSFKEIQDMIDANPGTFNRNIASIKTWVSNQIKKNV